MGLRMGDYKVELKKKKKKKNEKEKEKKKKIEQVSIYWKFSI